MGWKCYMCEKATEQRGDSMSLKVRGAPHSASPMWLGKKSHLSEVQIPCLHGGISFYKICKAPAGYLGYNNHIRFYQELCSRYCDKCFTEIIGFVLCSHATEYLIIKYYRSLFTDDNWGSRRSGTSLKPHAQDRADLGCEATSIGLGSSYSECSTSTQLL